LAQHADAILRPWELEAVALVLVLVPSGTDTPIEAATADHVDRRRDLGEHAGLPIAVASDHLPQPNGRGSLADRGHRRPALEHCFTGRAGHVVEVVVHPDRVIAEGL